MTDPIEEARALLAKATPGPWTASEGVYPITVRDLPLRRVADTYCNGNAALVAAAPRLLGTLAAECERLRAELAAEKELGETRQGIINELNDGCVKLERELAEAKQERDTEADAVTEQRETIKRLRAELAAVTAERDEAAAESMRWQSRWVTQLDATEAAESALAAAREAMPTGWRSMESAPRDGTRVLLSVYGIAEAGSFSTKHGIWFTRHSAVRANPVAWQPLPPPFTGDPATLDDRAAQRLSFARGNVAIDRDPDARRTVAVTGGDGNGTGKGGEHG